LVESIDIALLLAVIGFHRAGLRGRTRIQKEMCVLKYRDQVPINYPFKPYFYGPYSAELSESIDTLVAMGLVQQSTTSVGYDARRYDYALTEEGEALFSSVQQKLAQQNPQLLAVLPQKVQELEEMATSDLVSLAKECSGIRSTL
jgi:uncharacterized protein YwgA